MFIDNGESKSCPSYTLMNSDTSDLDTIIVDFGDGYPDDCLKVMEKKGEEDHNNLYWKIHGPLYLLLQPHLTNIMLTTIGSKEKELLQIMEEILMVMSLLQLIFLLV